MCVCVCVIVSQLNNCDVLFFNEFWTFGDIGMRQQESLLQNQTYTATGWFF